MELILFYFLVCKDQIFLVYQQTKHQFVIIQFPSSSYLCLKFLDIYWLDIQLTQQATLTGSQTPKRKQGTCWLCRNPHFLQAGSEGGNEVWLHFQRPSYTVLMRTSPRSSMYICCPTDLSSDFPPSVIIGWDSQAPLLPWWVVGLGKEEGEPFHGHMEKLLPDARKKQMVGFCISFLISKTAPAWLQTVMKNWGRKEGLFLMAECIPLQTEIIILYLGQWYSVGLWKA